MLLVTIICVQPPLPPKKMSPWRHKTPFHTPLMTGTTYDRVGPINRDIIIKYNKNVIKFHIIYSDSLYRRSFMRHQYPYVLYRPCTYIMSIYICTGVQYIYRQTTISCVLNGYLLYISLQMYIYISIHRRTIMIWFMGSGVFFLCDITHTHTFGTTYI